MFTQRILALVTATHVWNGPFPDIFRLHLKEVVFSKRSIEDVLTLVGLGNELVSKEEAAESDHD
jgi:hypothetical protein